MRQASFWLFIYLKNVLSLLEKFLRLLFKGGKSVAFSNSVSTAYETWNALRILLEVFLLSLELFKIKKEFKIYSTPFLMFYIK